MNNGVFNRAIALIVVLGSSTVLAQAPVGIDALYRIDQLPVLRPYAWAYQSSSHDRGYRNYDWTGFLGLYNKEKVIMDVTGPGCVYRMWFTADSRPLDGTIRFYLDGSSTAQIALPMEQLFGGSHAWFPSPLVGNPAVSSGGYYCYVPIPFRTGCRITHTNTANLTYFNITYHRFASAEGVTTFDGSQSTAATVAQWRNAGADPKPSQGNQTLANTVSVPGNGGVVPLATVNGPGVVQRLELSLPYVDQALLSSLRLRIVCDGRNTVSDVAIGSFFGSGLAPGNVKGLPLGMQGSRLYCYFPMPYRKQIQIALVNGASTAVSGVGYTIEYASKSVPSNMGRLYAERVERDHLPEGVDFNYVTAGGTGHLVGIVQNMRGRFDGQWYLEGDERFYVDGSLSPVAHGTGTEDLFNGGWYFENGLFTRPLHGHPSHTGNDKTLCTDGCYRFFIGDLIPYRDYLRAGIEHGGWNEDPVSIESITFSYKSPRSTMFLADTFDVGNYQDELAHRYSLTNELWGGTTNARYASSGDPSLMADTGRWIAKGGSSQFTISTNPAGSYVVLRRRLDYSVPRQQGDVFVNGMLAGTWYDAGSNATDGSRNIGNPAFRDSEFFIPPALARGKTSLDIRIVNTSPESEWTEFQYWAYIVRDETTVPADFNFDGDVDQEDFALLQQCLTGDLVPQVDLKCHMADLDGDSDVDTNDGGLFLRCLAGGGVPADPNCAD